MPLSLIAMLPFLLISLGFPLFKFFFPSLTFSKKISSSSPDEHLPPSYPIIGCLISYYKNRFRLVNWYTELLSKSPRRTIVVSRLGAQRTIVTANPNNVEYILNTNFQKFPKGEPFTQILGDFLGRGIFNVDGDDWTIQRKLASQEFSTSSLREFVVKTLETEVETRLLPLLEDTSHQNRAIDLQDVLRRFALDTVCLMALGIDPCYLDTSSSRASQALLTAFDDASRICAMRGMEPVVLIWKMKRTLNLGCEKKLKEAVRLVHEAVMDIIHDRKKKNRSSQLVYAKGNDETTKCDLLSRLLDARLGDELVRDMVISFILAGRDTTSSAMTWLFWLLSHHPKVEETATSEACNNEDGILDFQGLTKLNYIKACLCESMRLYPPVPWDSKHAAVDDVLPDGTPVKKGDRVTYFPYGMGRMEDIWGKDRFEFRPDRWFPETLGDNYDRHKLKVISPYKYPVFQAGPRVCIGKEMAFIQMKYVVASILRRFEIRTVSDETPVFVPSLTAQMAGGLLVKIRIRKRSGLREVASS